MCHFVQNFVENSTQTKIKMANVKTAFNKSCCDKTIENTAAQLTLICNEIEDLITYTEAEVNQMYANKCINNLQNHLKTLIQRVNCVRNEVKTVIENITMLKVKIEAVKADINNFHLKNLKNIKSEEKKKKAELKRLRANRNRMNEFQANAKQTNSVKSQTASTRSQNSDIVLHLRPTTSDSDSVSHASFASSTWTSGSQVEQNGSFTSIIRFGFAPYSGLNNNKTIR